MRNWKELGEVPDSDDESFDSLESQHELRSEPVVIDNQHVDLHNGPSQQPPDEDIREPTSPEIWDIPQHILPSSDGQAQDTAPRELPIEKSDPVGQSILRYNSNDIWDIPPSSEEPAGETVPDDTRKDNDASNDYDGPPSSPLSTPPRSTNPENDGVDELGELPPSLPRVGSRDYTVGPTTIATERRIEKRLVTFEEDEISTPYVTITAPLPGRSVSARSPPTQVPPSRGPSPNILAPSPSRLPLASIDGGRSPSPGSPEVPIRGRRSLRPRKPIQQHPYLLESVQYAHVMKAHGIKPVRVIVPEVTDARKSTDEDSQNRESEQETSQDQADNRSVDVTDDNQPILFDDTDDGGDVLALSPSPPRTSPARGMLEPSSQRSDADRTDNTSILGDDLPSIEELVRRPPKSRTRTLKRQLSSKLLPQSKRLSRLPASSVDPSSPPVDRDQDVWMLPQSSPAANGVSIPSQDLGNTSRFPLPSQIGTSTPLALSRHNRTPSSRLRPPVVDLTSHSGDEDSSGSESASSPASSRSGSEVIRRNGKRIRGVLPASWLRLDQQKNTLAQRRARRTPEPSPEPDVLPRRGVAVPKVSSPKAPASTLPAMFSDDSDDNDVTTTRTARPERRPSLTFDESPIFIWPDHDDAGSVVEEDHIDSMVVGSKRPRSSLPGSSTAKRQKTTHKTPFQGRPGLKTRQPRITDVLDRHSSKSYSAAKASSGTKNRRLESHKSTRPRKKISRAATPPVLSILDVIEPKAPKFLKIAARTSKRRPNLGRSSPSHKHINLGNRKDNVDALSVLRDWKSGRIRPKIPSVQRKETAGRKPLRSLSTNPRVTGQEMWPRLGDQAGDSADRADGGVENRQLPQHGCKQAVPAARAQNWSAQPAQLETEEDDRPSYVGFHARKRALDAIFRKARRTPSASSVRLEQQWDSICMTHREDEEPPDHSAADRHDPRTSRQEKIKKSRFRKRFVPKPVDLQAAHYTHANDPLPNEDVVIQDADEQPQDKLVGLGPYGTKYTHHFEVFPLDRGVYFHSTTLIGSGCITKVTDPSYREKTLQTRPRALFNLDGKTLRWGAWDDTASSELGILVDSIAEQLLSRETSDTPNVKAQEAAAFLLSYVVDSISFADTASEESFVARSTEVVDGFLNRIEEARISTQAPANLLKDRIVIFTHMTLVIEAVRQISESNMSLRFRLDTLLAKCAKSCIKSLLAVGMEDLRILYGDLQRLSARERGIRRDCIVANSWVVLMRVLENARIPRSSFWDVTQAVMIESNVLSGSDARPFENLWRDMFTLLPLAEVDDFGVVKTGVRHTTPVEGWMLPQQLLKRVFHLYTTNPRQPPSFNEYCRALAARCHYLVQEWGWRKCSGIIGTWFDFFGSQNLSHLRNEEVYKSPVFLEELSGNPTLAINPEDRCFHIFLKVLALVIRRLKKLGLTNDIKNLVARTLPNHDRQYLKEDIVHQRDLAALRNHHDLLCTLFWASPPELRPPIHLVEKLVMPGSSHKEACLINLRAWSQLARFVVSSGEGSAAFRPFVSWQNNIFTQVLDQYLSAATDIQQQVLALPKDSARVSDEVIQSMVKQNRAVAMDMLFVSLKASFDVLKLAGSLGVATFALNIYQLQQVFTRFDIASRDFDWTIINLAIDVLEHFVSRVEKAAEVQDSSDASDMSDGKDVDESTMLLDHHISEKLFSLGRTMMELPAGSLGPPSELTRCIEKCVKLSARVACRFIHSQVTGTAKYFTSGKYGLFPDLPLKLGAPYRKYVPLFVATLIKNHVYDFRDVGATLFQIWIVSVVKPCRDLAYENHLAEILKQRNLPYLRQVAVLPGVKPDYRSNFDFFACGISYMRTALREADSIQGKRLREEYARTLKSVMQNMRDDLAVLRPERDEHRQYMQFVRRIVGLIKSHGVGICVVDSFFTQPSADYSPPMEDPQLHTAGIVAYGVRLGEGETTAIPQLFHYLYNNFKIALINDRLGEEVKILEHAMSNVHILSFVLSRALPAVIWATSKMYDAWPLLDVYIAALNGLLTRSILSREISDDNVSHLSALLSNILTWLRTLRCNDQIGITQVQLHIMSLLMDMAAIFQPSLVAHLYCQSDTAGAELQQSYASLSQFAEEAVDYLAEFLHEDLSEEGLAARPQLNLNRISIQSLCRGIPDFDWGPVFGSGRELDPRVDQFANIIVSDVRKNWVVTPHSISLNTPGRGPGISLTQSGPGTRYELMGVYGLFEKLRDRLESWRPGGFGGSAGTRRKRNDRKRAVDDELFF